MRQHYLRAAAGYRINQATTDSDQYIANTELLLKGEGSSGQTNNTFVDSSASNHTITRNGDVTQGSFSPFSPKGWSMYVDGNSTTHGILGPNVTDTLGDGKGNWTIELWHYLDENTVNNGTAHNGIRLVNNWYWYNNIDGCFDIILNSNRQYACGVQRETGYGPHNANSFNTGIGITGTSTAALNTWNHVAMVKQGDVLRLYVNGVQEGTVDVTLLTTWGFMTQSRANNIAVGRWFNYGSSSPVNSRYGRGYFSNLRITQNAVYPDGTTFTPSTEPLTAITDCSLLTLQDNRYVDNSSLNSTITAYDSVAIKPTSPFSGDRTYPKASYFSGQFDGSNDYLEVEPESGTYFNFASGGFNSTSLSGFTHGPGSNSSSQVAGPSNGYYVFTNAQSYSGGYIVDNTARQYDKDFSITCKIAPQGNYFPDGFCVSLNDNASTIGTRGVMVPPANGGRQIWFHIVNWFGPQPPYQTMWLHEETTGTQNQLATADSNQGTYAGTGTAGYFGGTQYWWWDYEHSTGTHKIYHSTSSTKPSTARVTATFTMPSTPLHAYIGGGTGGANTEWRLLEWAVDTTPPTADDFAFGSGDFTYDAWIYPTSFSGNNKRIFFPSVDKDALTIGGSSASYGAGTLSYWNGSSSLRSTTGVISANQWTHVAVARNGSTVRIFVNGSLNASGTISASNNTANTAMRIGGNPSDSTYFNGYISNARVVKGTALYTTAFTPPTAPLTPVTNTKLLTLQDNYVVDHSPSGHSITNNGGVTLEPESPFSNSTYPLSGTFYSAIFDGSNDYLRCDTALDDFTNTSDNFTIEAWFNSEVSPSTFKAIFGVNYNQGEENNLVVGVRNVSGTPKISFHKHLTTGSTTTDENYGSFQLNTWNHIAATYDGSSVKLYLNGTQIHSVSGAFTRTLSTCSFCIGAELDIINGVTNYPGNYFDGYISNVRIVKGTALYTSDFTVPTEPLTAVSGTTLLTLQDQTIQDNSASSHSITNNGATVTEIAPFGAELIDRAGSMYFDGTTSDYLQTPSSTDFSPGTGDWTFECWVYLTSYPSDKWGRLWFPDNDRDNINIAGTNTTHSGGVGSVVLNRGGGTLNTSDVLPLNQWVHVAVVRYNNTSAKIFFNGVEKASSTSFTNPNITASRSVYIGANGGTGSNVGIPGYISNVRYVREALYTSAFTPPTAPLQPITNTKLLLSGNNGGVEDSLGKANCKTNGNMAIDTSVKKFGVGSFEGGQSNSDYLAFPADESFDISNGVFTIECWFRNKGASGTNNVGICTYGGTTGGYNSTTGYQYNFSSQISGALVFNGLNAAKNNRNQLISATGVISVNTWHYVVVVGNGSTYSLFVDGTRVATNTTSKPHSTSDPAYFTVGGQAANGGGSQGCAYYDDFRFTNGVARYDPTQTSHAVPTKTHPTI